MSVAELSDQVQRYAAAAEQLTEELEEARAASASAEEQVRQLSTLQAMQFQTNLPLHALIVCAKTITELVCLYSDVASTHMTSSL